MRRNTRLVSILGEPLIIFNSPECISDDIVLYNNFWEYEIFNKWLNYFPTEGLYLDLGANIGNHCVQFKHYLPNITIFAFEPYWENFQILKQNTARYKDVHCFFLGVGSNNSTVSFNDGTPENSGVVKVMPNGNNTNLVVALDTFNFHEPVQFIKIDIEGFEKSAFEGMVNLLQKDKPIIWLEDLSNDALDFLIQLDYIIKESNPTTKDYLMVHKTKSFG
jgi:FkbM family methyltransferase